jgi:hypothetical protein
MDGSGRRRDLAGEGAAGAGSAADGTGELRWASRVNPRLIRRMYDNDARGIVDEELIDEVGFALLARCIAILRVTEASAGRITCPRCEQMFRRRDGDLRIRCGSCGWSVLWQDFVASYQHKFLVGGGAVAMLEDFVRRFSGARSARERLLAIDRLIHVFHWELIHKPGRPGARGLIYAKNNEELITFLDTLSYGAASTPGLPEAKAEWDGKLQISGWHQRYSRRGWWRPGR